MMGERTVAQDALFYSFNLERHVPAEHMLRSIDPELLIIGYCMGIRSERRLCEEVHLNLAYRWFCRLGLERGVPDHSTFSKKRHGRFRNSDLLRELSETTVARSIAKGLVGGEGLATDASLIKAYANKQRSADSGEARLTSPSRTKRSPRRVPPRRHRSESPQDGQASPDAGPGSRRLRLMKAPRALPPRSQLRPQTPFFNSIRTNPSFRATAPTAIVAGSSHCRIDETDMRQVSLVRSGG